MSTSTYLIALGGNVYGQWGKPAVLVRLVGKKWLNLNCLAFSPIIETRPLGPSARRYANAVAVIQSDLSPPDLLLQLKALERAYGRRPGRRWGARPLDLDIIGWSGGIWTTPDLTIPHPAFRRRRFVLVPLAAVAPEWRDPLTGLTSRHLLARLDRKRSRP